MSNQYHTLLSITKVATAAITANRFVSHAVGAPTGGGNVLGVSKSDAAIGALLAVDVVGTAVVTASAAIAAGAAIEVLADGRAVTRSTGVTVARALDAAAAAGDLIEVLLIPN